MKKYVAGLMMTAAIAFCAPARAEVLADSITQAVQTHPTIDAGRAARTAARKSYQEKRAGYFPTLAVNGGAGRVYTNNDTTRGFTGGGGAFSWTGQGNVTMTQPIFAGFATRNGIAAAKERTQSAAFDLEGQTEDVALSAARAHLNLMRTQELLALADGFQTEAQKRFDSITLMVKEGAADAAEELQAREILSAAKNTRIGYEEAWRQAEADYIEAVGNPPQSRLDFGPPAWDASIPAQLDEALSRATLKNPRLAAADRFVAAAKKDMQAAKGDLLPRIDAELSYGERDQRDTLGGESEDAAAMVRMSWDISYGGAEFARIGQGQARRREAMARREALMREIEHGVRQKFVAMQIVDEQFDLLSQREEDVKGILASYVSQFEAGRQSNLELMGAHAKLFEAGASRTDAYYRRLLSRFELLNAMGGLREVFGVAEDKEESAKLLGVFDIREE